MSTTTTNLQWHVAATPPQDNGQQLAEQDLTIDDLITHCQGYDAWKRDYEIKAIDFRLHPNGRFSTGSEEGVYTLEESALTQLCARYGKPFLWWRPAARLHPGSH